MELAPDGSKPRGESTGGSRPTALSLAARVREKVYMISIEWARPESGDQRRDYLC
jgi:hypothetical protein